MPPHPHVHRRTLLPGACISCDEVSKHQELAQSSQNPTCRTFGILELADTLPLLRSLEELCAVPPELELGVGSPLKPVLHKLPPSIRRLNLSGGYDPSIQTLLEGGLPLLEELYLPAFRFRDREDGASFAVALKTSALAHRLKVLYFHKDTVSGLEKEDWEFNRRLLGLDAEGLADESVFPELERLAIAPIDWMSLGASLLAGKLPKLKRIDPILPFFDKDLAVLVHCPEFVNVYEAGKPTWQYWVEEVLPSRRSLSPLSENHAIRIVAL